MAIDYVVDYQCEPKDMLTTGGILARLKGRDRAQQVIQLYRDEGDQRPIDQMGFEFTRTDGDGQTHTETVLVRDLMSAANELELVAGKCAGCPANLTGKPFGCFGQVAYPISDHAERWLLMALPTPQDAVLVWTLLGEHLRELNERSAEVQQFRETGTYMESTRNPRRHLGEIAVGGNNVFYLLFMQGHISPSRAAITLLFFNAIRRNLDATEVLKLTPAPANATEQFPFLHTPDDALDDTSIRGLKGFFAALYAAWQLNVDLLLDV
jgi:hypothetical protein